MGSQQAAAGGRIVWQGPSWQLRVRRLARSDGGEEEKGIVEHPGGVVLVPLLPGNQVLMLRQYRLSLQEQILELPAGTRGWQEAWLACAQRELREETGYRAASLTPLGDCWPAPGYSDEVLRIYLATGLEADPLPGDFDEQITVEVVSLAGLLSMARDGRLRDAKSVVALLRAAAHLGG